MKRILTAAASLLLATAAHAGDGYGPGAPSWGGFYLGLHGGYVKSETNGVLVYNNETPNNSADDLRLFGASNAAPGSGGTAGVQIGYNWQAGMTVFGVEAEGAWLDLNNEKKFTDTATGLYDWNIKNDPSALLTLRGRLGFVITPAFLLYGTGGVAFAHTKMTETVTSRDGFSPALTTAIASSTENRWGWTVGGGLEYMLARGISVKAEYSYVDLGSTDGKFKGRNYPGCPNPACASFTEGSHTSDSFPSDLTMHMAKIGLNFHF